LISNKSLEIELGHENSIAPPKSKINKGRVSDLATDLPILDEYQPLEALEQIETRQSLEIAQPGAFASTRIWNDKNIKNIFPEEDS